MRGSQTVKPSNGNAGSAKKYYFFQEFNSLEQPMSDAFLDRPSSTPFFAIALCMTLGTYGCNDAGIGKTYPVSGRITIDNQPLNAESTVILLKPDVSRGNHTPFMPSGSVDENGTYEINTSGQAGAPPGWYKVVVTAHSGSVQHPRQSSGGANSRGGHPQRAMVRSLVPAKYGTEQTTDLALEVVENPTKGAFDLRLSNK